MRLFREPERTRGNKIKNVASYQPEGAEKDRLAQIMKDYQVADENMNTPYEEFNYRDVVMIMNDNQRAFNNFIPEYEGDAEESWRANTVRPLTRNKLIAIAAHITASVLYPDVLAQNDQDETDRDASIVLKDMLKYSLDESKYERKFVMSVISALYNPCVIIEDGFRKVMRKVKREMENGTMTTEQMIDEVYSGFQMGLVSPDELFIANPYEPEIQKQGFLIRRRVIAYEEAETLFGHLDNFKYVFAGLRYFYADTDDLFYQQYEEGMTGRLVEFITYYNRHLDLELRIVNGVLLDHPDRPIQRTSKRYPFAKSYFEPITERFFYGKSAAEKMAPDQGLIDVLYNMAIDASFLQTMPPVVTYGNEDVDSAIVVPGKNTPLDFDTRVEALNIGQNMNAATAMMNLMERSASESTVNPLQQGASPVGGVPTAFQVATEQQNAMRVLGLFGKFLKTLVEDFGELRMETAIEQLTVGEVVDLGSTQDQFRLRAILIPDKTENGKKRDKKIEFTTESPTTQEEYEKKSMDLLQREITKDMHIVEVNPTLLRKLKYMVRIAADVRIGESETVKKALNLEAYDRLINNQSVDQEAVTRKFLLENYVPGEEDKFIKKEEMVQKPTAPGGGSQLTDMIMQQAGANQPMV